MDAIWTLNGFVRSIRVDASLSALLRQRIVKAKSESFLPQNYFYVTHVTNPANFFWMNKQRIERSNDIARKLLLGKRLERIAGAWFRRLPNFYLDEGKLDGVWVGIPGVRGSMDYRIGESIVEFKTKDALPATSSIVLDKYPQDVEQLCFYSVMHPDNPKTNFLVFMNNVPPYDIKAFRIEVVDFGKLKTLLLNRIKLLNDAIANDDYTRLGRCRYFETGCEYGQNSICKCAEMQPLSTELLKSSIEISFDEDFTNTLIQAKEESGTLEETYSTKDIIAPRKYFMKNIRKLEGDWVSDTKREEYLACLGNLIKRLGLNLSVSDIEYVKSLLKEPKIHVAQRWLRLKSSSKEQGELVPYLVKISQIDEMKKTGKPSRYALAELAISCAIYGRPKGLVFVVYPNLNDHVQVYEVIFRDNDKILNFVKQTISNIDKACNDKDLMNIHACPEFMNENQKCALFEECHSNENSGCVRNYKK